MDPFRRIFNILFFYMMQAEIAEANLGLANSRIPPSWCIERDRIYPLRFYRTDLEVWAASTDLDVARQGPAASMRISGAARMIVREIPVATLINGAMVNDNGVPVQLNGLGMLLRILERRYGATEEETQIHAISELMQFTRTPGETTDMCMARFDIAMHRANNFGGVLFAPQLKAWLLLSHLRIPRSGWMVLLSATNGLLPADDDEYTAFTLYIRRNGHLHDTGHGDAQKSIAQPYFTNGAESGNQSYFGQSWNAETSERDWQPAYAELSGGNYSGNDDNISWHSFSTGHSDEGEPIDWTGTENIPPAYQGEHIYLGYRNHKRMWRKFGGKSRPRFKGVIRDKTKGKGKFGKNHQTGKGGFNRTFWVDDFGCPIPIQAPAYPAVFEPEPSTEVYFKGKGKGNPIGKDGKQMLCSICDSNMHFRAKCSKGSGKTGSKGGKGSFWASSEHQYLGPDIPNASSSHSEHSNPNANSTYFTSAEQQERSRIYFSDGSEEALVPHGFGQEVQVVESSGQVLQAVDDHLRKYFHPPTYAWMNACYHTNVRLAVGEAMLVDCGAVGDLSGDKQIHRMAELARQHGHGTSYTPLKSIMNVDGVGKGSTECKQSAVVPVVTADGKLSTYTAPMITDSEVPALLGLNTMTRQRVVLDLVHDKYIMIGAGGFEMKLSPGSTVLDLKRAPTGHLMLPCSHWDKMIPGAKQHAFIAEAAVESSLPSH